MHEISMYYKVQIKAKEKRNPKNNYELYLVIDVFM